MLYSRLPLPPVVPVATQTFHETTRTVDSTTGPWGA